MRFCVEKPGGIFNIGTSKETSVNEIINCLTKVSGKQVKVKKGASKSGDVDRIFLDNSNAEKVLGWSPRVELEEGIAKTYEWILANSNP